MYLPIYLSIYLGRRHRCLGPTLTLRSTGAQPTPRPSPPGVQPTLRPSPPGVQPTPPPSPPRTPLQPQG